VKVFPALDADDVRTRSLDPSAHGVEEVGEIHDMGFFGRADDLGVSFGPDGRQHDIDGRADARAVHIDFRALQAVRL